MIAWWIDNDQRIDVSLVRKNYTLKVVCHVYGSYVIDLVIKPLWRSPHILCAMWVEITILLFANKKVDISFRRQRNVWLSTLVSNPLWFTPDWFPLPLMLIKSWWMLHTIMGEQSALAWCHLFSQCDNSFASREPRDIWEHHMQCNILNFLKMMLNKYVIYCNNIAAREKTNSNVVACWCSLKNWRRCINLSVCVRSMGEHRFHWQFLLACPALLFLLCCSQSHSHTTTNDHHQEH